MQTTTSLTGTLSLDNIIEASNNLSGLSNIGEPDIYEAMKTLIDALNNEAKLNERGQEVFKQTLIQVLVKRQRIHDTFIKHPEILEEPIQGPIFITGLPRSGTTKIQRMMATCDEFQKLPLWKILNPLPITIPGHSGNDHRMQFAIESSRILKEQFPTFYAGHPMNPEDPDEEEWLLDLVMRGYTNPHIAWVPTFEKWMDQQNFDTWYAYLRKLIQLYQWQDGSVNKPWLLKAPSHMNHMKLLFKHFPNAIIIHCHRDPVTTTVSLASLVEAAHWMYSDYNHPEDIGSFTLSHWSKQMSGYMENRAELEKNHPFFDIAYKDITGNLVKTVTDILSKTDFPVSSQSIDKMNEWDKNNPPGKHGKHHYSIERYGFTPEFIRDHFSQYLERFSSLI